MYVYYILQKDISCSVISIYNNDNNKYLQKNNNINRNNPCWIWEFLRPKTFLNVCLQCQVKNGQE
jgi:hypothetical protein